MTQVRVTFFFLVIVLAIILNTNEQGVEASKYCREHLELGKCKKNVDDAPDELNIPTYYFFTSGACGLAVFLYLTTIHKKTTSSLKDLVDFHIDFPGLPPVPSSAMPIGLMDRTTELYDCFIKTSTYLAKCDGVVVNSFEYLEKKALDAIRKGDCTLAGEKPPPVALWVAESEEDGLVSASELEQRVAELFQSEKGKEVRERVMVMRDEAAVAIKDGGSSDIALKKLIESLERVGRF
ncbi:hypothetical protein ACFE04_008959 [Oxalis oulophora]